VSKNPINRGVTDHIKEGLKNIPKTYNTLYNRPGMAEGVGGTVKTNLKVIATGKTSSTLTNKVAPERRAKLAAMGAASVTPLGPVAAFAAGVKKSVDAKADAKAKKAAINAAKPGTAPKPGVTPKPPVPVAKGSGIASAPKSVKPVSVPAKAPMIGKPVGPKKS